MNKIRQLSLTTDLFRKTNNWTIQQTLWLNKCVIKYLFIIPNLSMKYHFHRWKPVDQPLIASEVAKCYHDDVIMITASVCYMPWWIYQAFTMQATIDYWHFLRSFKILKILNLFIESFSRLVAWLFLCDVTNTISRKNLAPNPSCKS